MKKIIEVLEYGENDIRFNTDIDVTKNPQALLDLIPKLMFSMSSSLFGKKEINVYSVIRSLISADFALSNNRKEMIKMLDEQTKALSKSFRETLNIMQKQGKAAVIPVGTLAAKMAS